jgi:hypothetical protein
MRSSTPLEDRKNWGREYSISPARLRLKTSKVDLPLERVSSDATNGLAMAPRIAFERIRVCRRAWTLLAANLLRSV